MQTSIGCVMKGTKESERRSRNLGRLSVMVRICALAGVLLFSACAERVEERPPNFVVLLADDLGYGDLGVFGHPTIKTPNLDRLARQGLKLTQFYAAASLCTPSRAGLLTGRLPVRSGMAGDRGVLFPDSAGGLPATETTLAEALGQRGYATAMIGKWHLGHLPQYLPMEHGFDHFFGIPYSNDMRPEQDWDYAQENFPPLPFMDGGEVIERSPDQSRFTERFTRRALEFIEANRTRPFFLYLPYTAPHTPLAISAERAGKSRRGLYGDVVEEVDWSAGRIVATLESLGLAENTLVIFSSDNGPWGWQGVNGGSAGLLRGKKGSPWEGGFRVPAIAWMPGTVPANTLSESIVSMLDLMPTFLSLSGADSDANGLEGLDGVDVSDSLLAAQPVRDEMFYYRSTDLIAYRRGPWKIFIRDPDPWTDEYGEEDIPLLFNVETDPSEQFNIAPDHPQLIEALSARAAAHMDSVAEIPSELDRILPEFQESFDRYNQ